MTPRAKGQSVDLTIAGQVQTLDLERMRVSFVFATDEACARPTGRWQMQAIAAALKVDPSYLTKLRSGEKPLSLRHIADLPDDIERIYARHYAEQFDMVCVDRPSANDSGVHHILTGVLCLVQPRLPERADRMAKADVAAPPVARKVGR